MSRPSLARELARHLIEIRVLLAVHGIELLELRLSPGGKAVLEHGMKAELPGFVAYGGAGRTTIADVAITDF